MQNTNNSWLKTDQTKPGGLPLVVNLIQKLIQIQYKMDCKHTWLKNSFCPFVHKHAL